MTLKLNTAELAAALGLPRDATDADIQATVTTKAAASLHGPVDASEYPAHWKR